MTLIENWRQSYRSAVQWFQGLGASAMGAWMLLDATQRAALLELFGIPADRLVALAALIVFLGGRGARVVKPDVQGR